jgi:hypothetical protein
MPTSYLPYNPQQQMLLPYALQEWLPKGHLAYYISDMVDELDLSAFHARYGGGGPRNQPYHPAMMVKVLLYAYATGVFSSRKIARKLHEDVAFRVPGAGNFHWMRPGGRSEDDERTPRDKDGKPKRGPRYKRQFGVPEESAQENFTDPDSRIMKRAGGGFDQSYNGHTAVDAHAQIIVAAE